MMAKKKNDLAASILSGIPSEPVETSDVAPEMDGEDVAVDEIMSALESKDPTALKEALKSFIEICTQDDSYESESEAE